MQPSMELEHTGAAAVHTSWRSAASPKVLAARRANAGEVLLMRRATKGGALGLVHRSPPIDISELLRVVLVLSTVERT